MKLCMKANFVQMNCSHLKHEKNSFVIEKFALAQALQALCLLIYFFTYANYTKRKKRNKYTSVQDNRLKNSIKRKFGVT